VSAAEELYQASPIRRRHRSTKAEVEARREKLFEIIDAMRPAVSTRRWHFFNVINWRVT
jgi:hypothetical protein